jgi:hypothetical protein
LQEKDPDMKKFIEEHSNWKEIFKFVTDGKKEKADSRSYQYLTMAG